MQKDRGSVLDWSLLKYKNNKWTFSVYLSLSDSLPEANKLLSGERFSTGLLTPTWATKTYGLYLSASGGDCLLWTLLFFFHPSLRAQPSNPIYHCGLASRVPFVGFVRWVHVTERSLFSDPSSFGWRLCLLSKTPKTRTCNATILSFFFFFQSQMQMRIFDSVNTGDKGQHGCYLTVTVLKERGWTIHGGMNQYILTSLKTLWPVAKACCFPHLSCLSCPTA